MMFQMAENGEMKFKTSLFSYPHFLAKYNSPANSLLVSPQCVAKGETSTKEVKKYLPKLKASSLSASDKPESSVVELGTDLVSLGGGCPFYSGVPDVELWVNEPSCLNQSSNSESLSASYRSQTYGVNSSFNLREPSQILESREIPANADLTASLFKTGIDPWWGDHEDVAVLKRSSKQRFVALRVRDILISGKFRQNNQPLDSTETPCPKVIVVSRFWEHLFLLGGIFESKLNIHCAHLYPKVSSTECQTHP